MTQRLVPIKTSEATKLKSKNKGRKLPYYLWVSQKLQTLGWELENAELELFETSRQLGLSQTLS